VQYASVELVGLSNDALGAGGEWRLMMLSPERMTDWAGNTAIDLSLAPTIAEIGTPLKSESLAVGRVNQYIFAPVQRSLLDEAVNGTGRVGFRLDGPVGEPSSLFRWEGATSSSRPVSLQPVLRIIASVGRFVVITNTPTPQSMLTAVAEAKTAAARATRYGTPTAFPRSFATVTPVVVITPRPSPANQETQAALNAQATFVAITIGTFTPTPPNWVTATPSFLVPYETLAPPTPTPTIAWDNLLRTPVPSSLRNTIIFMSNRFGYKRPLVMKPDGTVLGVLTGSEYYQLARTLDVFSPDRTRVAVVSAESSARLQIWMRERNSGNQALVTKGFKKTSYDPAWSPDGSRIVFVGTETGVPEIYVYDIGNQISRQLTLNSGLDVLNQVPSWSPDSRQIVFKSNRGTGHFQIWIMNADGSGLRNLSQSPWEDTDPVWVKID
jgi:hypothetical protein